MFLYFDMGNVLLYFDHPLACRQMAAVAGVSEETVWSVVFDGGLQWKYEAGEVSTREFYDVFCQQTGSRPDYDALRHAAGAIFKINDSIVPVVSQLRSAGYRMGVLSNTCECHWEYVAQGRYGILTEMFDVHVLSYEVGALKPAAKIYRAAIELAGVPAEQVFFTDDIAGHVAGARELGIDAVQYTTTPALVQALGQRGVRFNY
jgi:HAD superfamily hydrolase (TIGR01509 family)